MPDESHKPTPDEPVEEFFDLTPDGDEPGPEDFSAEEMLDKLEFGAEAPTQGAGSAPAAGSDDLQREKEELEAKLLRTAADYQNYVRRATRELDVARQQRIVDVARSLVTVLDHFDRALEVDPGQTNADEVLTGVASIRDELLKALGAFGVKRIDVEPGTEFDPNQHEAMMHQPHDDFASGQVVQAFQPGYAVNETPVRPAQVSVAQ